MVLGNYPEEDILEEIPDEQAREVSPGRLRHAFQLMSDGAYEAFSYVLGRKRDAFLSKVKEIEEASPELPEWKHRQDD